MFDCRRFLVDKFRDPDGVVGTFNAYGLGIPSRDTIRKWFERGSLPSDWFPMLVVVAELENGEPVRLAEYLMKGSEDVSARG